MSYCSNTASWLNYTDGHKHPDRREPFSVVLNRTMLVSKSCPDAAPFRMHVTSHCSDDGLRFSK